MNFLASVVLALLATVALGQVSDLVKIAVGEAPGTHRYVVLNNPNSVWLSCESSSSLFWTDANLPILSANRFYMSAVGWQTFNCSNIPAQINTTSTRIVLEAGNSLYSSTIKRSFPTPSSETVVVSSSHDVCSRTDDSEFVISWNNENVTGWLLLLFCLSNILV